MNTFTQCKLTRHCVFLQDVLQAWDFCYKRLQKWSSRYDIQSRNQTLTKTEGLVPRLYWLCRVVTSVSAYDPLARIKMAVNQMQDSPARATRSRHGLSQSEQVPATLCITEKWIRKRLNLQLDSLGQFTGIWKPIATWRCISAFLLQQNKILSSYLAIFYDLTSQ